MVNESSQRCFVACGFEIAQQHSGQERVIGFDLLGRHQRIIGHFQSFEIPAGCLSFVLGIVVDVPYSRQTQSSHRIRDHRMKSIRRKMSVVRHRLQWWLIETDGVVHHEECNALIDKRTEKRRTDRILNLRYGFPALDLGITLCPLHKGLLGCLLGFGFDVRRFILKQPVEWVVVSWTYVTFVEAFNTPAGAFVTLLPVSDLSCQVVLHILEDVGDVNREEQRPRPTGRIEVGFPIAGMESTFFDSWQNRHILRTNVKKSSHLDLSLSTLLATCRRLSAVYHLPSALRKVLCQKMTMPRLIWDWKGIDSDAMNRCGPR